MADVLARLARWRVRLGFLAALAAIVLARPTWTTWSVGLAVALAGEALRIWAAGHLEKGREVTRSGPYRWTRHPLYVGSAVISVGVVLAAWHPLVAVVALVYMGATLTAAVRTEEAYLRQAFGNAYDDYRASTAAPMMRAFSSARALRNHEHRAVGGVVVGFALLALKLLASI